MPTSTWPNSATPSTRFQGEDLGKRSFGRRKEKQYQFDNAHSLWLWRGGRPSISREGSIHARSGFAVAARAAGDRRRARWLGPPTSHALVALTPSWDLFDQARDLFIPAMVGGKKLSSKVRQKEALASGGHDGQGQLAERINFSLFTLRWWEKVLVLCFSQITFRLMSLSRSDSGSGLAHLRQTFVRRRHRWQFRQQAQTAGPAE
jgi:hypothetical protein